MNHHISIVHQDPSSFRFPLLAEGPDLFLLQLFLNGLGNGLNLAV
jgi:hypothetical protein